MDLYLDLLRGDIFPYLKKIFSPSIKSSGWDRLILSISLCGNFLKSSLIESVSLLMSKIYLYLPPSPPPSPPSSFSSPFFFFLASHPTLAQTLFLVLQAWNLLKLRFCVPSGQQTTQDKAGSSRNLPPWIHAFFFLSFLFIFFLSSLGFWKNFKYSWYTILY